MEFQTIHDHPALSALVKAGGLHVTPGTIENAYVQAHLVLDRMGAPMPVRPDENDDSLLKMRLVNFLHSMNIFAPKLHVLRTESQYYKMVESGAKRFEVRQNDRNFKPGDYLRLDEIETNEDSGLGKYSGQSLIAKIGYVLTDERFVKPGYCVMQLKEIWALHSHGG